MSRIYYNDCCLIDVRATEADAGQSGDPEGAPGQQCAAPAAAAPPHCAH